MIEIGSIVQLNPETTSNKSFGGCMLVVTEVKAWGVQGYVQGLGTREELGGQAYYRAASGTFEETGGKTVWGFAHHD